LDHRKLQVGNCIIRKTISNDTTLEFTICYGISRSGTHHAPQYFVPVQVVRNEVPQAFQEQLNRGIFSAIGNRDGLWEVDITSELEANAWDVEIMGPDEFYFARRFSGEDRDAEVISAAIHAAVLDQAA
jgi:hypothetical protein